MFTGLIETTGRMRESRNNGGSVVLGIVPEMKDFAVAPGDSVAVNGVCLTLERSGGDVKYFRAVDETVRRSTLGAMSVGAVVNLERSLRPQDRMGGHFVLGHVDGIGRILRDRQVGDSLVRTITIPRDLCAFMAEKGSVAVDGISLTIAASGPDSIDVSLIPYSLAHTTMTQRKTGDAVNIECDVLARYIVHAARYPHETQVPVPAGAPSASLYDKLERLGF